LPPIQTVFEHRHRNPQQMSNGQVVAIPVAKSLENVKSDNITPEAKLQGQNWVEQAALEIDYTSTLKKRKELTRFLVITREYPLAMIREYPLPIAALIGALLGSLIGYYIPAELIGYYSPTKLIGYNSTKLFGYYNSTKLIEYIPTKLIEYYNSTKLIEIFWGASIGAAIGAAIGKTVAMLSTRRGKKYN